jgi:hypothetical protein
MLQVIQLCLNSWIGNKDFFFILKQCKFSSDLKYTRYLQYIINGVSKENKIYQIY